MTESEMILLLERHLSALERAGADVSGDMKFFNVGEWLLAFEGVYALSLENPGVIDRGEIDGLVNYFGEEMSEFDN